MTHLPEEEELRLSLEALASQQERGSGVEKGFWKNLLLPEDRFLAALCKA